MVNLIMHSGGLYNFEIFKSYYPFGMVTPGRSYSAGSGYRFGFNGKESDDQLYGENNGYDLGLRIYNPRLGRFLSLDSKSREYPWQTPYAYFFNNPVAVIDVLGAGAPDGEKELSEGDGATPTQYTIKPKDNFWILENKLGLPHGNLQKWNPTLDPNNLQIGTVINTSDPYYYDIENAVEFSVLPFDGGDFTPRSFIPAQYDGMPTNLWMIYSEFVKGTGPVNSIFIENPLITGQLASSNGVNEFRNFMYSKFDGSLSKMQEYASNHNRALVTDFDPYGSFYPWDEIGNGVMQFIGSCSVDAFLSYDNKTIIYVVTDSKSLYSLILHSTNRLDYERTKQGDAYSNTYQKYIWFETFNSQYGPENK
ncbi:MAG TPA: RHS repeat-associated core domain-containing protein [Chitinophagales bacterium]|nr:RHS repeat-associated core domain-containing protein [Chitinophagales bacterium]